MTGIKQGTYAANFLILGKMWSDFFSSTSLLPDTFLSSAICYKSHFCSHYHKTLKLLKGFDSVHMIITELCYTNTTEISCTAPDILILCQ